MSNLFENLNEKQIEAVMATEGKVRVIAGAGSGKTRVLAHRYAYLVNEVGIDPGNILCMTFTNKAAREMKNRIAKLVHSSHVNDFTCTIHGFCVKFLRREIHRIGYPRTFTIIDDEDSKDLAKQVMREMHLDATNTTISQFLTSISKYKVNLEYIDNIILPNSKIQAKDVDENVRYVQLQLKNFALDFNDLINFTLYIMEHFPDALNYWQNLLNYIQVDEVQDCNGKDWAIINNLSALYNNLFVVGDPDQAIYEWRGALPDMFINFLADTDITLNQNYRSTPNILDVANCIIAHNENRIPKELFTIRPSEKIVVHFHGKSEIDECGWISEQINNLVKQGVPYKDVAILYRSSYLSRNVEQALMKKQIKYIVWGGIRFFERREIKDCLAYMRLIANHNDDISFRRIINVPKRKFGESSQKKLQDISKSEGLSLFDSLAKHKEDEFLADKPDVIRFLQFIDDTKEYSSFTSIGELLDFVLRESGLEDMYREEGEDERLENIAELKQSIKEYEALNVDSELTLLESYLQDIALYTNADYKEDGDMVKLMTIHQAKGLEFPYVFICGLSEGIFPNHRSIRERTKRAEEEERRLMYVAVTRAEKSLFLSESEGYDHASRLEKFPSRFLMEVKDGLIEVKGDISEEIMQNLLEGTKNVLKGLDRDITPMDIQPGSYVSNKIFGQGIVLEKSSDTSYKVKFENGIRFIQAKFLKSYEQSDYDAPPQRDEEYIPIASSHRFSSKQRKTEHNSIGDLVRGDIVEHIVLGRGTVSKIDEHNDDSVITVNFEKVGTIDLLKSKAYMKLFKISSATNTSEVQTTNPSNDKKTGIQTIKKREDIYYENKTNTILHVGDIIHYYQYGQGVVERVWIKGGYEKAMVNYGPAGTHCLVVSFGNFGIIKRANYLNQESPETAQEKEKISKYVNQFNIGDKVFHPKLGKGVVLSIKGEGAECKARVEFEGRFVKKMHPYYLTPLNNDS